MDKERIREIAKPVGGVVALSLKLGLCRASVSAWKIVPAEHILAVERITGVPREQIRPDLYVK